MHNVCTFHLWWKNIPCSHGSKDNWSIVTPFGALDVYRRCSCLNIFRWKYGKPQGKLKPQSWRDRVFIRLGRSWHFCFCGNLIFSLTHRTNKCDIAYWLKIKFLIYHITHKQLLCGYVKWWSSTKFELLNSKMDSNNMILFIIGPCENTKAFSEKSWLIQICTWNNILPPT